MIRARCNPSFFSHLIPSLSFSRFILATDRVGRLHLPGMDSRQASGNTSGLLPSFHSQVCRIGFPFFFYVTGTTAPPFLIFKHHPLLHPPHISSRGCTVHLSFSLAPLLFEILRQTYLSRRCLLLKPPFFLLVIVGPKLQPALLTSMRSFFVGFLSHLNPYTTPLLVTSPPFPPCIWIFAENIRVIPYDARPLSQRYSFFINVYASSHGTISPLMNMLFAVTDCMSEFSKLYPFLFRNSLFPTSVPLVDLTVVIIFRSARVIQPLSIINNMLKFLGTWADYFREARDVFIGPINLR